MRLCDVHHCTYDATTVANGEHLCNKHAAMRHGTPCNSEEVSSETPQPRHPLLNAESSHYSMVDSVEAIERMEQMYTTAELMVWANLTAMKYRLRIGNKGSAESDAKKIMTYENYYAYLSEKSAREA